MHPKVYTAFFLTALLAAIAGCENSIDPLNEKRGIYSVYGYLDVLKDQNFIRIKDLNRPLDADTPGTIDAEVRFSNLSKGTSSVLEDSTVTFDGVKTHNFGTEMDIIPGNKYELTVTRSDGRQVKATATAPTILSVEVITAGKGCLDPIKVTFDPIERRKLLELDMGFEYNQKMFWVDMSPLINEPNKRLSITFRPADLLFKVFAPADVKCYQLDSEILTARYTRYGPDYFQNTFTNSSDIPGGVGKFGSYYEDSFTISIDTVKSKSRR